MQRAGMQILGATIVCKCTQMENNVFESMHFDTVLKSNGTWHHSDFSVVKTNEKKWKETRSC